MDHSAITQVGFTNSRNKELFINQAKEARQARELARQQDKAATTIQACLKGFLVRKKLKENVYHKLRLQTQDGAIPRLDDVFIAIKELLLFCDPIKDRNLFQSLFPLLSDIETKSKASTTSYKEQKLNHLERYDEVQICLLRRILGICIQYIMTVDHQVRINLVQLSEELQFVNLLVDSIGYEWNKHKTVIKSINTNQELDTSDQRLTFVKCITDLISENLSSLRAEVRQSILENFIEILIKLTSGYISTLEELKKLNELTRKSIAEVLTSFFSAPGIVYLLQKCSPQASQKLSELCGFDKYLFILPFPTCQSSSSSLFMLANFIHLAQINQTSLIKEKLFFVLLTISLLKSCQNSLELKQPYIKVGVDCTTELSTTMKKKNAQVNLSFHPLLGWLSEKQPISVDKDMIKSQLSYLWSFPMIELLFEDLLKEFDTPKNDSGSEITATNSTGRQKNSLTIKKSNHNHTSSIQNTTKSNTSTSILRRAVERVSLTIPKSVTSTYAKLGTSGQTGCDKLTTPKARYLFQACCLFNTAIHTLTIIKQDIIGSLCLHGSLIIYLWKFISTLGPNNGLLALLEYLVKGGGSSAAEFNILILFCECASHLINILDDSELYEKQLPFSINDLISMGDFMNNFVFRSICDNLIPHDQLQSDPLIHATYKLLTDLYKRDCRRPFTPPDFWLIQDIRIPNFLKDLESGKPIARAITKLLPHSIPHRERVMIFRKLVAKDRAQHYNQLSTLITIHRSRIVEDGYQQLTRLQPHALKGLIRVKFVNDYGLDEAGIDQDGVFKEFLEDTIKKIFDPQLNLFSTTSEQCLYPSPTSRLHENHLSLFKFVGKMIGKALYDGIVVDVPFALFFLSRVLGQPQSPLYSPIDELPSLDLELYKSLTYLKHYKGDVSDLDLTFSIDQDFMGKIETYELEPGGKSIAVTNETRVRYIHSVANFRMRKQIEKQTEAFVSGFRTIIDLEWLSMFSASEFQRLISGDNTPIDLQDLRRNTTYYGGFHNNHRVICWLWDILDKDFNAQEQSLFLKFVTSCSKPPLLGFSNLEPPFSVRCVEVGDDQDPGDTLGSVMRVLIGLRRSTDPVDRLPTSSTCFNLLKLPNYHRRNTLRDKLRYAIRSNPGFELS